MCHQIFLIQLLLTYPVKARTAGAAMALKANDDDDDMRLSIMRILYLLPSFHYALRLSRDTGSAKPGSKH